MFKRQDSSQLAIWWREIDKIILVIGIALILSGNIFNFLSTSNIPSEKLYDSKYFLFYKHFTFSVFGFLVLLLFSFISNEKIKVCTLLGFIFFLFLLILVHFFGIDVKGSRRWLNIFFLRIQPVEFIKPFLILIIALILNFKNYSQLIKFFLSCLPIFCVALLLLIQPDYSQTLLVVTIWMIMLFVSGVSILFIATISGVLISLMVSILFFFKEKFFYIFDRLTSWLGKVEISYQSEQALNAIKAGGFFGRGVGEGILKEKVPEAHTDYVTSVIAEEYGILIVMLIFLMVAILIIRIFFKIRNTENNFNKLSLLGIASLIILQSFINLGVTINLLPSTGMPFPFISYGGSSIIGSSMALGLVLSLSKKAL